MSVLPTDRRHERGVARLTDALRKPRVEALLKSWLSAIDDVEEELDGLAVGTTSIEDAVGAQLRVLARIVGSQEVGDDELLRVLVRTRILVVRSSGTGDQLLRILQLLTETPTLVEYFPASLLVGTLYDSDELTATMVHAFMNRARTAGVRLQLLWTTEPEATTFEFASAPVGDVLDLVETACAMTALICIDGAGTELVSGALTLTAVGDAEVVLEQDRTDVVTADTWPREALASGAGLNGWVSSSATAGNFALATSTMVVVGFYTESFTPGAERVIASKRDDAGGNAGWEIFLSSLGRLSSRIDSTAGAPSALVHSTNRASLPGWHVAVFVHDVSLGGVTVLADETGENEFGFFVDDPTTTDPLALGTARAITAPGLLVKFLAVFSGAQVEGLGGSLLAGPALDAALANDVEIDAAVGFADDAQTVGGGLIDVK
jgi:hypothetical protein